MVLFLHSFFCPIEHCSILMPISHCPDYCTLIILGRKGSKKRTNASLSCSISLLRETQAMEFEHTESSVVELRMCFEIHPFMFLCIPSNHLQPTQFSSLSDDWFTVQSLKSRLQKQRVGSSGICLLFGCSTLVNNYLCTPKFAFHITVKFYEILFF